MKSGGATVFWLRQGQSAPLSGFFGASPPEPVSILPFGRASAGAGGGAGAEAPPKRALIITPTGRLAHEALHSLCASSGLQAAVYSGAGPRAEDSALASAGVWSSAHFFLSLPFSLFHIGFSLLTTYHNTCSESDAQATKPPRPPHVCDPLARSCPLAASGHPPRVNYTTSCFTNRSLMAN
jgi:hypothetical protein